VVDFHALIWLLLGGITRLFSFGRWTIPLADWFVPLFLIRFMRGAHPLVGVAALWLVLWMAISISNRGILHVPGYAFYAVSAVIAGSFTLPYLADRLLAPHLPGFVGTLTFPLAWVTMELIVARTNPFGTWGAVAYSQYGNLPLMQLASVTGITGIAFLVSWFGSLVNWVWTANFDWRIIHTGVLIYAGVFVLVLSGGAVRLTFKRTKAKAKRMAAIGWPKHILRIDELSGSLNPQMSSEERAYYTRKFGQIQDWFLENSRREARSGAEVIVWPENNLMVYAEDYDTFLQRAKNLARQEDIYLLMGIAVILLGETRPFEPQAVLVDPSGEVLFTYVKNRLVPGWEASHSKSGDGRIRTADTPFGRMGAVICYDMDFPDLIRQVGKAGVDLLLVPVAEPEPPANVGLMHHRMATFRAIENGVPLVRASRLGFSSAVDLCGRILAWMDDAASESPVMVAQVPINSERTIYATIGDAFAWLCAAGFLGMSVWGILR
jgi:apolipoprotein N-acyltransferase